MTEERKVFTKVGSVYAVTVSDNRIVIKNKMENRITTLQGPRISAMIIEELTCGNPDWTTDDVLQSYSTLFQK